MCLFIEHSKVPSSSIIFETLANISKSHENINNKTIEMDK